MNIKGRLLRFIAYKGLTNKSFEIKCGLGNGFVSKVGDSIRKEKLDKISNAFPELNIDWIINEKGEMLKNPESLPMNNAETNGSDQLLHTVPLVPVSAQGGSLNDFSESVKESDCERIISPVKAADLAITVSGDSMAPEFPSGSKILIKKIDEQAFIEWGKVYVLDTCNGVVIKEIHRGQSEDEVECYSINPNPKFQPFSVKFSDIFGMYRVIMCLSLK